MVIAPQIEDFSAKSALVGPRDSTKPRSWLTAMIVPFQERITPSALTLEGSRLVVASTSPNKLALDAARLARTNCPLTAREGAWQPVSGRAFEAEGVAPWDA